MTADFQDPLASAIAHLLRSSGFATDDSVLDLPRPALVFESPFMLGAVVVGDSWGSVESEVSDVEVALANWAAVNDASPRRWDLYIVVLLKTWPKSADEGAAIEEAEANTELTRKIVRSNVASVTEIPQALRPLLPLLPLGASVVPDPTESLVRQLRVNGIDPAMAEDVVAQFMATGQVRI